MKNKLMMGLWRFMIGVPPFLWEKQFEKNRKKMTRHLGFITEDHRLVHHFVVRELPYAGKPLEPALIARDLDMPIDRISNILDDLESRMTFLFRNTEGHVMWAYPVTVEQTPHHVTFDTGETLYAA